MPNRPVPEEALRLAEKADLPPRGIDDQQHRRQVVAAHVNAAAPAIRKQTEGALATAIRNISYKEWPEARRLLLAALDQEDSDV